jgi:AmmeMemoRadiSam system protein B
MSATVQPAGVAGFFYPANPDELASGIDGSLARAASARLQPKAVIAPHAGHIYSGDIAASAYRLLGQRKGEIKRVILLGPNHRQPVRGIALSPADIWATPLGHLPVARNARDWLARQPGVAVDGVPFINEHSLEVHLPFIQRSLGAVEILPILVGQAPRDSVSKILETLWGGPETAIIVSSDLSHFHDYATCQAKDEETTVAIERLRPEGCDEDRACGRYAIHGLLDQAQQRDLRVTALDVRNSGDMRGSRDRVVGYGSFAFEYAHTAQLDAETRHLLLNLAHQTIRQSVLHKSASPKLQVKRAASAPVACTTRHLCDSESRWPVARLRGSLLPHRPLINDIIDNTWESAFEDPRFPPLTPAEAEQIHLHVSILSSPRRIPAASEAELLRQLRPDIDGLILRDGTATGAFSTQRVGGNPRWADVRASSQAEGRVASRALVANHRSVSLFDGELRRPARAHLGKPRQSHR